MVLYLVSWLIFDFLAFFLLVFSLKYPNCENVNKSGLCILLIFSLFLLAVFAGFSGDYIHYEEIVEEYSRKANVASSFEPFYEWLLSQLNYSYVWFRIVISGMIILCLYLLLKSWNLLCYPVLLLYIIIPFSFSSNGIRQGAAGALFSLGIFCLIQKKHFIASFCCMFFSFFLHKSIFLLLFVLPFLAIKLSKKNVLIMLFAFPLLVFVENQILELLFSSAEMQVAGTIYLNMEEDGLNTFSTFLMDQLAFFSVIFLGGITLLRAAKLSFVDVQTEYLNRFLFGCIYLLLVFYFLNIETGFVYLRFMPYVYLPLIILIGKIYKSSFLYNRKILFLLALFFVIFNLQTYRWFLCFF